ncbi:MAG: heavy-metal-associated domain-containing protein [Planctomycetes bacterium]|nr:heavy-metal-associated domain-containing protein [Planctomycetota bacterium]MCC7168961.1 heavy-metal-associated domain-containing protein [Planctomycetota bacterium]
MFNRRFVPVLFALGAGLVACSKSESTSAPAAAEVPADAEVVTLAIEGMTCGGCEGTVRGQLEAAAGVVRVDAVNHETKRATLVVKKGTDKAALCGAVKDGYTASIAQ